MSRSSRFPKRDFRSFPCINASNKCIRLKFADVSVRAALFSDGNKSAPLIALRTLVTFIYNYFCGGTAGGKKNVAPASTGKFMTRIYVSWLISLAITRLRRIWIVKRYWRDARDYFSDHLDAEGEREKERERRVTRPAPISLNHRGSYLRDRWWCVVVVCR